MCRVICASCLHIQAVAAAFVRDRDGAPAFWHVQQYRRTKEKIDADG
jgi:hypothetical protein